MNGNISLPSVGTDYSGFYGRFLDAPHLLIAGTTGSGKSVFVNGLIHAAMQTRFPFAKIARGCSFIFLDAKRVEFAIPEHSPHCIYYASEPEKMLTALQIAIGICDRRGKELEERNREEWKSGTFLKKYTGGDIYVVIDEFADMVTNKDIKESVINAVQKIAQIGRSNRVHLWLCTQTVKADVLSTKVSCDFDHRIGLRVVTPQQSRMIIDAKGLESIKETYGHGIYFSPKGLEHISGIPYVPEAEQIELAKYWMHEVPEIDISKYI